MTRVGRPPLDRESALRAIEALPRSGRRQVTVNGRALATQLGCDRGTVAAIISDLEVAGRVRRRLIKGRSGLVLELLKHRP